MGIRECPVRDVDLSRFPYGQGTSYVLSPRPLVHVLIDFIFRQIFYSFSFIKPRHRPSAMPERSVLATAGGVARNLLLRRE